MFAIRMSDPAAAGGVSNAITSSRAAYNRKMEEIVQGTKYLQRSDAPLQTGTVQSLLTDDAANTQWGSNIDTAAAWENATASAVEEISTSMQRINELVVECNSGTVDESGRQNIAVELNTLLESLVQYGNSTYLGTPLFAGTATCVDKNGDPVDTPFTVDRDADGNITGVYFLGNADPDVYPDTSSRTTAISGYSTTKYGLLGEGAESLFQYTTYENTGTAASPNWQNVNVRLFDELIKLRDTMTNTIDAPDETNCARIQAGVDNVIEGSVTCYASQARLKSATANLSNQQTEVANNIDAIQGNNEEEELSKLYQIQNALESSMNMLNTITSMSILEYI